MEITHYTELNGMLERMGMNVNIDKHPHEIVFYGDMSKIQLTYFKEEIEVALQAIKEELKNKK